MSIDKALARRNRAGERLRKAGRTMERAFAKMNRSKRDPAALRAFDASADEYRRAERAEIDAERALAKALAASTDS